MNFIVGCALFSRVSRASSVSGVSCHMHRMSSMYRFHSRGWIGSSRRKLVSSMSIKRFA